VAIHRTTDLFAATTIAAGQVLAYRHKGHTARDVVGFFAEAGVFVLRGLAVDVVLDTLLVRKALEVTTWLARRDGRGWYQDFTPVSRLWLSLVERWFGEFTDRWLRGGLFIRVPEFQDAITAWPGH